MSALAVDVLGWRSAFDGQLIDVLADTVGGKLLATRGQDVSVELRERLTNLRGIVRQPRRVLTAGQEP